MPTPDAGARGEDGPTAVLVERACDGDTEAWARLYQSCFDDLYRRIRYLTGDPAQAEELTQEAFVQALTNIHKYDARAPFPAWLGAVGLNVVRNHWRKHKSTAKAHAHLEVVHAVAPTDGHQQPERVVLQRQRERALHVALERIPENLREVFVLRELQGLSRDEVASTLGITPNNVSVRANRARARVREELELLGVLGPKGEAKP